MPQNQEPASCIPKLREALMRELKLEVRGSVDDQMLVKAVV